MRDTPGLAPQRAADAEETLRGLVLVALAYAVISTADAAVKWVLPEIGPAAAMVWRGLLGAAVVALLARGRGLRPVRRGLITARSLTQVAVSAAWYLAWALGVGLADSYAVAAVAPLLMTLLAIPMLGERVGWRRWASTAVGFLGVLIMLQPGGDLWRWESALLLVATAAMAVTRIWTRMLGRTDTPAAIAFWLMAAHVPAGAILLLVPGMGPPGGGAPPLVPSWSGCVALLWFGIANGVAHTLFARAFAMAPIGAIAPFEYTPLLWGTIIGFLIWAEVPAWSTLSGAAVVIAAGLYNVHRERVRRAEARAAAVAALERAG
jgi:drug/metabolite transporter (DMT)-like permease